MTHPRGSAVGQRRGGDPFAAEAPKTGLHESLEKSLQLPPCPRNTSLFYRAVSPARGMLRAGPRGPMLGPFPRSRSYLHWKEQVQGGKAPLAFSLEFISLITLFCEWLSGGLKGNKV